MTDIIDKACEIEQQQRDLALQNRPAPPKSAVRFCIDCGDELPEVRQKMHCCRCVTCQTLFEKKQREYRKW